MKALLQSLAAFLMAALATHCVAIPANVEVVETFRGVTQYRLKSNGMTIVLVPQRASPVVTFMVVYHVGSRNEAPGNTGSAHLLEHMIFNKSTQNFGRANGHKTFQEVLHEAGADFTSTNMTTGYDRMNGYSTVPSDKLELAIKIEADRLGRGLILESERQTEMSVVRNEYEISENNPQSALFKATIGTAFQAHPYRWPVLGYRSDIEGVTIEKLREHYRTYFWPDNAEAVLVGDFDTEAALAMFDREFGGFKRSPHAIPTVITVEPEQEGERRVVVRRPGTLGHLLIGYMRPGIAHPDQPALDVLATVLEDGANSRLRKALVDKGLATTANAYNYSLRDPFPFLVAATIAPGRTHAEVETAIRTVLADVVREGISDTELRRAQRQLEVTLIRERDGTYRTARTIGAQIALGQWKRAYTLIDDIRAVSAADVQRTAAKYLLPDRATVGWFVPHNDAKRDRGPAASGSSAGTKSTGAARGSGTDSADRATAGASSAAAGSTGASSVSSSAASASTAVQPEPARPFAQRTLHRVLPNGITLAIVRNRAAPTVAIHGVIVGGESSAPPGKRVLPALLAKVLDRGTLSRTKEEIGALIEDVGATRNYATTLSDTTITATGLARDLDVIVDVLADELSNPAIRADELARAKKELENDILRIDDSTAARAMERLGQLVFPPTHPYRPATRAEKLEALSAIGDAELRDFHRRRYNGSSMILAIVGDVDIDAAAALIARKFGATPKGERNRTSFDAAPTAGPSPVREAVTLRGKANMNIVLGTASGLKRTDPHYEAALIANAVLGQTALASRIGRRVRDTEGLSYSLASRFAQMEDLPGLWYVNVNVAPQNYAKALKSTREEIDRYAKEGATDAEVAEQKSFFAGNYRVGLGSNAGIAEALVGALRHGFGPGYLDSFPERVRAVTTTEVNAALRRHLIPERLHVIVAGDLDRLADTP